MTLEDRIRNHMNAGTDHELPAGNVHSIVRAGNRRRTRNQIGAAIAGGVLALGAVVGTAQFVDGDNPTELATDDEPEEQAGAETTGPEADPPSASDEAPTVGETDTATTIAGDFDTIVGTDDGFAGLRHGESGLLAIRSSDGLDWSETPVEGLPFADEVFASRLIQADDGRFVATFEVFESDSAQAGRSRHFIATSEDLVDWEGEFVDLAAFDGQSGYIAGLDVGDGGVLAVLELFEEYSDPASMLVDLGLITAAEYEASCGWDYRGPGTPFVLLSCDFESEVPAEAADPGREDAIIVLESDHPEYDAVTAAIETEADAPQSVQVVLTGPIGGPYELAEADLGPVFVQSVHAVDGDFLAVGQGAQGTRASRSADGIAWEPATLADIGGGGAFAEVGVTEQDSLILGSVSAGELTVHRSTDGAMNFTETVIPLDEGIVDGWVSTSSGTAGTAMLIVGSETEFDTTGLAEMPPVILEVDGYTVTFDFQGALTVESGDGVLVHIVEDWVGVFEEVDGIPGVFRFEGADQERIVFLDPATGDPLLTVTEEEFTETMEAQEPFGGEAPSEPPEFMNTLLFSSDDGVTWRTLDIPPDVGRTSQLSLAAVGDDEVLVHSFPIFEPEFGEEVDAAAGEAAGPRLIRVPLG